jgi:hypothetical protein
MAMASVTLEPGVDRPGSIFEGSGPSQQLAQLLRAHNLSGHVIIDLGETEEVTIAQIAQFIQSGGIWVSGGGYPFYYTASQPKGNPANFSRFCQALGVPDPSSLTGGEFWQPPNAQGRALVTTTPSLPNPWLSGAAPIQVGTQFVWTLIAVPAGKGFWFYASAPNNPGAPGPTMAQYAAFIANTAPGSGRMPITIVSKTGWLGLAAIAAVGVAVVGGGIYLATRHRTR